MSIRGPNCGRSAEKEGSVVAPLLTVLASCLVFTSIFFLRSGPQDPLLGVAIILGLVLLPVLGTAPMLTCGKRSLREVLKLAIPACLLPLLPALALASPMLVIGVAALVVGGWCYWLIKSRGEISVSGLVTTFGGSALLAALCITEIPADRLLMPENAAAGIAHTDALFHVTLAQMIKLHGIASLGADGLAFQNYHFGSHAVAAGIAKLSGLDLLHVYVYWGTAGLFVQVLWAVFLVSRGSERGLSADLWTLAFAAVSAMLVWVPSGESFNVAIASFLGLLVLLKRFAGDQSFRDPYFPSSLAFALVGTFLCASVKVSVGFFAALFLAWVVLQNWRRPLIFGGGSVGLVFIAGATAKFFTDQSHFIPLHMLKVAYMQYLTPLTVVSYCLPLALIASALLKPRFRAGPRSMAIEWRRANLSFGSIGKLPLWLISTAGVMQMLVISALGCIVLLFTFPIGSNMAYFSLVLLMLSLVSLPPLMRASRIPRRLLAVRGRALAAVGVAAVVGLSFAYPRDVKAAVGRLSVSASGSGTPPHGHQPPPHPWRLLREGWAHSGKPLSLVRQQLDDLAWSKFVREVAKLGRQGEMVVHVRADNVRYWRRLQGRSAYWCMSAHLMLPAQTGIVQIKGIAPVHIEAECGWGALPYYGFGRNQGLHRSDGQPNEALCYQAKMLGARRVYVVNSIDNLVENALLECGT